MKAGVEDDASMDAEQQGGAYVCVCDRCVGVWVTERQD